MITPPAVEFRRRFRQLILGLVLVGVGIGLMVEAHVGLGPWDTLHQGISRRTGIPMGTVGILVGLLVFVAWVPVGQRPGIGTVINVVTIGLLTDATLAALPRFGGAGPQWVAFAAGLLFAAGGMGLYIGAGLGPGPRDGLMTGLAARGYSLRLVRTLIECSALAVGWALGGNVGLGTVVVALTIGPLVQVTLARFTLTAGPPPATVGS